ncbi:MAG: hypothetical protein ACYCVE_15525, partial [Gemmatimonadaceae bacterium]
AWPDRKASCGQTAPYARFYGSIFEVLEAIAMVWVGKIAGSAEDNLRREPPGAQPVLSGHSGVEGSVAGAMTHRGYSRTGVRDRKQVIVGAAGSPGRARHCAYHYWT